MRVTKKNIFLAAVVLIIGGSFTAYQVWYTYRAHLTLENYSYFRGCVQLGDITADSALCTLKDGSTITLVKIDNRWFLQGDGPGVW